MQLTDSQRRKSQKKIIYSTLVGNVPVNVLTGALMISFLADSFRLSAIASSLVISLTPLISIVRFLLLTKIEKFPKIFTLKISYLLLAGAMGVFILLPEVYYSYQLTILLILFYLIVREVGQTAIWGHIIALYSTPKDRGDFTAKIRTYYQVVSVGFDVGMLLLIGDRFEIYEFKAAIFVVFILSINGWFWLRGIPEVDNPEPAEIPPAKFSFFSLFHTKMMKAPLVFTMFFMFFESPVLYFYLKYGLNLSSDLIVAALFLEKIGTILSLIFWGKLIDVIGYRNLNLGVYTLTAFYPPLLWLISPISPQFHFSMNFSPESLSFIFLFILVFFRGFLLSGIGLGVLSLQAAAIEKDKRNSFLSYNLVIMLGTVFTSAFFFLFGFLLDLWKNFRAEDPIPSLVPVFEFNSYTTGFIVFHWVLIAVAIFLANKKDDDVYSFRIKDFFTGIVRSPLSSMILSKRAFNEREQERVFYARWLGHTHSPLSIPQLENMLNDSAFDVKVEAIRSLAQYPCEETQVLLRRVIFDNESVWVWEQAVWALGETKDIKSVERLLSFLDESYNPILRSYVARALGKIGDRSAIPLLAEKLEAEENSLQFISSCCRALFRLNAVEYSDLVVESFLKIRGRQERFEMMMTIAEWLGLSQIWTSRSSSNIESYEMIYEYIESRSEKWQARRKLLISLFDKRDYQEITKIYEEKIRTLSNIHELNQSIGNRLQRLEHWSPLHGIAVYWLFQNYSPAKFGRKISVRLLKS